MAYIGREPKIGNFQVCDAISVVNGQAAYTMQVGGANVSPETANHMIVSLNGIIQAPGTSYTVSGSTITFASNLATGDVINFIHILGSVLDLGVPSDATVTNAKLAQDIISGETALTVSPDTTDEVLISNAGTLNRADISVLGNAPAFHVRLSADQTLTNSTATKIQFNTEEYDTNSAYDNSSNYRFTVPTGEGGKYFFYTNVLFQNLAASRIARINFYKNGSSVSETRDVTAAANDISIHGTMTITLSASDYIEVFAYQNDSGTEVAGGGSTDISNFGGYRLIGV